MKIVALLLTIFLFAQVNDSDIGRSMRNVVSAEDRVIIDDVPLELIFDGEKYVVNGAPERVSIQISGPKSTVIAAENRRNFQAVIELSNPSIGEQRAKIVVKDLSDKLQAVVEPEEVTITVQEKVTREYVVQADYSKLELADGYTVDKTTIEPGKVNIIGGRDTVNRVDSVVVVIEKASTIEEDFTYEGVVTALDEQGQALPVTISPSIVKVSTVIGVPSKEVAITPVATGKLADGLILDKIELSETTTTITGKRNVISDIDEIKLKVDLSKLTKSTEYEADVPLPKDVHSVALDKVKVKVTIGKSAKKEVSNIPVRSVKLASQFKMEIQGNRRILLTAEGSESLVKNLRAADFRATIDLADLKEGSHTVPIKVEGPDRISTKLSKEKITVLITKK